MLGNDQACTLCFWQARAYSIAAAVLVKSGWRARCITLSAHSKAPTRPFGLFNATNDVTNAETTFQSPESPGFVELPLSYLQIHVQVVCCQQQTSQMKVRWLNHAQIESSHPWGRSHLFTRITSQPRTQGPRCKRQAPDLGKFLLCRQTFHIQTSGPDMAGIGRISILLNFTRIVTEPFTEGFGSGDSCACTGVDILDVWQRSKLPKPSPITCKNYQPSHDSKGVFEPFHALSPTLTLLIVKPWQLETSLNSFSPLLYFLCHIK